MADKQRYPYDQEHWWRDFLPNQVHRPFDILSSLPKQQPQLIATKPEKKKKKKKSRGNRAERNFQRRLRNPNLDDETRVFLIQARAERKREQEKQQSIPNTTIEVNKINHQISQMTEDTQIMEVPFDEIIPKSNRKKRKRYTSTKIGRYLSQSFSRLSISQECSKKQKIKNIQTNNIALQMIDDRNDQTKLSVQMFKSTFVPQYLTVSDRKFKDILSKAVPDGHKIYEWLDSAEKLKSTRQLAHTFNMMYYFKLQQELWKDYFDLGMTEGIWAPRILKSAAKQHYTCVSYGRSEKFVEQRQKTIQHQINRTNRELQQQLIYLPEWTENVQPSIDSKFLSTAVEAMVKHGQYRLNMEFKHKRAMLKLDADDHRFISAVYAFEPTEEQIVLIKMYRQAIANEQKALEEVEILRKRVSLRRLPQSFDKILNESIAPIQTMLSRAILHKDRRASMASRCSKTITQYKFDLMAMTIAIAQDTARGYTQLAIDTKNKLHQLDNNSLRTATEQLIQAIEIRGENMKKRAQELFQYKIISFFRTGSGSRQRQRQRIRRSNLSIYTNITASSPFIETDLNLSPIQMSIFIKGLKYIPPCQSRFSRRSIDDIVNEQYKTLRSIVQGCLDDHRVQLIEPREKEGFPCLKRILYELQSKK
ncbi:unnamed protein product [Rotaria sordida]|uniref:Uncharacterized protein n=1 Tax=Rotaria sordida TaxID=392033 RepID=A0A815YVB4_9BILA|nr:unnamed protein product [Rotaria sordida]CAF1575098.1 unnamed protein product [Rotaria sordida]